MTSLRKFDGYMLTDQRAVCAPAAELLGYGRFMENATYMCWHCGGHLLLGKAYRPPEYCRICDKNICNECDMIRREADYEHIPWHEVVEMVRSGKWVLADGSSTRRPVLLQLPPAEH